MFWPACQEILHTSFLTYHTVENFLNDKSATSTVLHGERRIAHLTTKHFKGLKPYTQWGEFNTSFWMLKTWEILVFPTSVRSTLLANATLPVRRGYLLVSSSGNLISPFFANFQTLPARLLLALCFVCLYKKLPLKKFVYLENSSQ